MNLTLFRNKGVAHAITNSPVSGSICFDRSSLRSRILCEQPLSEGSLPNMNAPSSPPTKVVYLCDYGQFLRACLGCRWKGLLAPNGQRGRVPHLGLKPHPAPPRPHPRPHPGPNSTQNTCREAGYLIQVWIPTQTPSRAKLQPRTLACSLGAPLLHTQLSAMPKPVPHHPH